jgi:Protein of unknown function (DUF3060)
MKLVLLGIVFVPAIALADKVFVDNGDANWDCKADPVASIRGNDGTITFTGPCKKITVDGNHNTVKVAAGDRVTVNGNQNTVDATAVVTVAVNGNDNTVHAKGAKASNSGQRNTVDVK